MSYLDWKVGDKVVCVDDNWTLNISRGGVGLNIPNRLPMTDEVLTISGMLAGCGEYGSGHEDGLYLEFEEIPLCQKDGSVGFCIRWNAAHFRPVQTRKTDISQFQAMLHDQRQKVPV